MRIIEMINGCSCKRQGWSFKGGARETVSNELGIRLVRMGNARLVAVLPTPPTPPPVAPTVKGRRRAQ